jgi:hypothetical protein
MHVQPAGCRVYLLRGMKLKGMDDSGLSDVYVKLKLGKATIDDRKKCVSVGARDGLAGCVRVRVRVRVRVGPLTP